MTDDTPDPHVLEPGHAPTPFTADEIRIGCPTGRTIRLRVDLEGEASFQRVSRYVDCDQTGATLERFGLTLDGAPLGETEADRVTWLELQAHASFPAEITTIDPDRIDTAIGELDCLRYTVRDGSADNVFWFADDVPGMPIRYLTREDGRVVSTVSVIANEIT